MSVRVWARVRVRVRASAMLRGHGAVEYDRSGDHVVLYSLLRMRFKSRLNVY